MKRDIHTALVIRSFLPTSSRIIVFDKDDGKCNAFVLKQHIPHGSLIEYYITQEYDNVRFIVCNIELVPVYTSSKNQLLFHHILELCHYFVPLNYKDEVLFDFLYKVWVHYQDTQRTITEDHRQHILFTLCVLLGIYPEKLLDPPVSSSIYDWIYSCVMQHPMGAQFKTVDLLTSARRQ